MWIAPSPPGLACSPSLPPTPLAPQLPESREHGPCPGPEKRGAQTEGPEGEAESGFLSDVICPACLVFLAGPNARVLGAQLFVVTKAESRKPYCHTPRNGPGATSLDTLCKLKPHLRLQRLGQVGAQQRALGKEGVLFQPGCCRGHLVWLGIWSGLNFVTEGLWGYGTHLAVSAQLPRAGDSLVSRINKEGEGNKHVLSTWSVQALC